MSAHSSDHGLKTYIDERDRLLVLACSIVESQAVAEEVVQESWLRWQGKGYPMSDATPIFRRIVRNLAYDFLRRQRRERDILSFEYLVLETSPDSERILAARQDLDRAVRALKRLPRRSVRALRLRSGEGLSYREIGRRMNLSQSRAYELVEDALVEVTLAIN